VVTPYREELGGDLVLGVLDNFPDKGGLTFRDLVLDGQDVEKSRSGGIVHDVILNHLCYGDF